MSKRTMILMLIAAAAVVGLILWSRRSSAVTRVAPPAPTVAPSQLAPQAVVANAFSDLLQIGANSVAQWFTSRISPPQAAAVPYKPPPINTKPPTPATPAASSPNLVTTPGGYYA